MYELYFSGHPYLAKKRRRNCQFATKVRTICMPQSFALPFTPIQEKNKSIIVEELILSPDPYALLTPWKIEVLMQRYFSPLLPFSPPLLVLFPHSFLWHFTPLSLFSSSFSYTLEEMSRLMKTLSLRSLNRDQFRKFFRKNWK